MRRLNKQKPISSFATFVSKNKPTQWEQLPAQISRDSRFAILCNEQDCLCGYSEIVLEDDSFSSHIDHYYKRNLFPEKTFDWNNFVVSTVDEDFGGKYKDNTYKITKADYPLIFNPVLDDMSQYISYLGNGKMIPMDGISQNDIDKVEKTIEVFNLNCQSLKDRRKGLIASLQSCSAFSKDEIREVFSQSGFISVLNWFLKTI